MRLSLFIRGVDPPEESSEETESLVTSNITETESSKVDDTTSK